jgi:hypothetical protein
MLKLKTRWFYFEIRKLYVRVFFAGLVGMLLGAGIVAWYIPAHTGQSTCSKNYPLINSAVDCGDYEQSAENLQNIDSAADDAVALYIKEGKATNASVWVRDLTTQQWASTNEYDRYAPASLLKVPLMIAYYKLAELEPNLLDTQFTYRLSSDASTTPEFPPSQLLVPGQSYSVETLIEHMIKYSDNNAADVLAANIDQTILSNIFVDLGIEIPSANGSKNYDFITAKTYASIFRSLYNASYLNAQYSQKALGLLSQTGFKGISASLPHGTVVADKFGERGYTDTNGTAVRELHDCGIVYKPGKPYVLCIMTSGASEDDLLSVLKNISSIVYDRM